MNYRLVRAQIDLVLANFDFERVHKVMSYLNWRWGGIGIPSISDLKNEAKRLLDDAFSYAIEHSCGWYIASGGLCAEVFKSRNTYRCSLAFELTDFDTLDYSSRELLKKKDE